MKSILTLSLVINLVLIGAVGYLVTKKSSGSTPQPVTAASEAEATTPKIAKAKTQTATATANPPKVVKEKLDWRMVESEDYRKYIENLRSIGCPEETIRDIIIADVNKLFESRRKELNSGGKKFEFWKTGNMFSTMMDSEKLEKQQKLAQEKRALLKDLLGVEPEEKFDMFAGANPFEGMLDFLPSDKQSKVMQLFQDMQVKMAKQFEGGAPDAEDMKSVQKVQKEMDAELAKILSPEEFEDYQLRMSQTAMMMRMQLGSFDPNEQEFRDIFKLKNSFDDEFGMFGMKPQDKEEAKKYEAAKKAMEDQLKTTLGEERYADYSRAQDWSFQQIHKITERQKLPKESAIKVYDMKKVAEDEARNVRNNKSLSKEQRDAALEKIRTETERSIGEILGEDGLKSYQNNNSSYWLKNISPKSSSK